MILYSIEDKIANEFGPVFQAKNDGVAKRMYVQTMQGDRILYADDYRLWSVGEFDVETGVLSADKRLVYEPKSEIVKAGEEESVESNHRSVFDLFRSKSSKGFEAMVNGCVRKFAEDSL